MSPAPHPPGLSAAQRISIHARPRFLVKLSAMQPVALLTYFPEVIKALAVDAAGNVYVAGTTT